MLISLWPLIICIIGLVIYLACTQAKPAEVGRLMFFAGLLVTCFTLANKVLHL